ncbi:thiamine pyrophosphate-dependent enzyme [Erwinia billingiae]|uniref:thiamine pyrophosphate-dependent enzyme n=1 Tax=Erwinia billingiae TaxID=182337 RepID=UPI003207F578
MNKTQLIKHISIIFNDHPLIFTTGYASRIAFSLYPEAKNHFYMVGSMGMAAAIGRGVASGFRSAKFPVVVDGDGAMLMGLHSLLLEMEAGDKILHIVANDCSYTSTGGQGMPDSVQAISAFARAAGYCFVRDVNADEATLPSTLDSASAAVLEGGSAFLNVYVESGPPPQERISLTLPEVAKRFSNFLHNEL